MNVPRAMAAMAQIRMRKSTEMSRNTQPFMVCHSSMNHHRSFAGLSATRNIPDGPRSNPKKLSRYSRGSRHFPSGALLGSHSRWDMRTALTNRSMSPLRTCAMVAGLMLVVTSCQFSEPGNPHRSSAGQSEHMRSCAGGHPIVDAFGYPTCVPSHDEHTGIAKQAVPEPIEIETSLTLSSQTAENSSSSNLVDQKSSEESDEWNRWDVACRQRVHDSLASPYGIYEQCMQDKKLSAESP